MAWTAPMTAVFASIFTAPQWNGHVRDNLNECATAKATVAGGFFVTNGLNSIVERFTADQLIATAQTCTSTTYDDLATVGPEVTVVTTTYAIVVVTAKLAHNTVNGTARMAYKVSGATDFPESNTRAMELNATTANDFIQASRLVMHDGSLAAGSNTFTAKYASSTGTATFSNRRINTVPL